jgi:DNA-binding LytR/AlgR family response regulator
MGKINVLIVEDENIVAKDIQHSLKKLGYNVVGIVSSGEKAIAAATEKKPEVVLMDIMLQGDMSGIEAAREIRDNLNIPVIYLTAYADENTLSKAKITEPYGYIIKPFKEIDIHTSIEMALYKHGKITEITKERDFLFSIVDKQSTPDLIFVKSSSRLVKLKTKDIFFVEALKDYVTINTLEARYTIHSTMKDIQARLPEKDFVRVHRSFIVRIDKIAAIEAPYIVLDFDGIDKDKASSRITKQIPIGGSYKDDLYKKINLV